MRSEADLGERQGRRFRFRNGTMDFDAGWVLGCSQLGGLSPGEVFECFNAIRDGDPESWVRTFTAMADRQEDAAQRDSRPQPASNRYLAAAVAARAAWHLVDPASDPARVLLAQLERCFQASLTCEGSRLAPVEVQTSCGVLPGYASAAIDRPSAEASTWYVVIGGGDTFREDLWFFGGGRALAEGFEVLMVDLPGQGSTPYRGLHFGEATVFALREVLVRLRTNWPHARIVLTGYSGGGYFTLKALDDPETSRAARVDALVASTPCSDIALLLERGLPTVLTRRPDSAWARLATRLAGRLSLVVEVALTKYRWQFGVDWIGELLPLLRSGGVVDVENLDLPLLAFVGESEPAEAGRQALAVYDDVLQRQPASRLVRFEKWTGADAHCQVNNLRLAQDVTMAWLEGILRRDGVHAASAVGSP
jgi:pimeloyl-ACP methyl ester carboxylesterase